MATFNVNVNGQEYSVTPFIAHTNIQSDGYKIETKCEYLFTIGLTDDGYWVIKDKKVEALDESLIQDIGWAIEKHSG